MAMDGQQRGDFLPGRRLPALGEGDQRFEEEMPSYVVLRMDNPYL